MGWCKPLGGHAYETGWTQAQCDEVRGDYRETDPHAQPPPKNGCFIATAAYGSPLEPEVQLLRRFQEDVLLKTRAGTRFFEEFYRHYYQFSPAVVEMMSQDPRLQALVRWIVVTPIVNQLECVLRFPDASLADVPEPWRAFLAETRTALEAWGRAVEFPEDFAGLSACAAAEEIGIVLRYLVRTETTRGAYLDRLAELGQIPLHGQAGELEEAARRLRASGRSPAEIARIVGPAAAESVAGAPTAA
jgi:hypothetical protein